MKKSVFWSFVLFLSVLDVCSARPWILLFGSRDCEDCAQLKSYWVAKYSKKTDPVMVFVNIDKTSNYRYLNRVEDELELVAKGNIFPIILAGDKLVSGREGFKEIEPNLPELMKRLPKGPLFSGVEEAVEKATSPLINYDYRRKRTHRKPAADRPETVKPQSSNDGAKTSEETKSPGKDGDVGKVSGKEVEDRGASEQTTLQAQSAPAASSLSVEKEAGNSAEDTVGNGEVETVSGGRVYRLLFFEQPGCQKCARQGREFELLKETFPTLEISSFDVTTLEGQAMLTRARNVFDIPDGDENLAPMVCWSVGYVTGRLATADELETALKATSGEGEFWTVPLKDEELSAEENRLEDFIGALTWWSVIGGGLLDGINPCAFATSVFLISYLLYLKRRRRDIIIVGGSFCLGVFLAYFLYGFAVSALLRQLQTWEWVRIGLYGLFSVLGFVLGVLHLRDAFKYKRSGKASDMDMGLSKETHRGIHNRIKKFTEIHSWLMAPMAVVLGAVVSSMELACTGQVYFPVLTALSGRGFSSQFVLLLFLYNVMFILPLAVITVLAGFGVGAKSLGDWAKNHVFITKVLMAVLFFGLGCLMLVMIV